MKKNVVLVDFNCPGDWEFLKGLNENSPCRWETLSFVSNQLRTNIWRKIYRYVGYFLFPFSVFLHRKKYKSIIAWQQFYGLIYAFFCRLFHVKKSSNLYIMTFIYKAKKGIIGGIYKHFMTYIVQSKYIDFFIVFSEYEINYYAELFSIDESKFKCMKLGIADVASNYSKSDNGTILSCGRSNRDYAFLIDSLAGTKYQVEIICDELKIDKSFENIKIYNNINGSKFFKKLAKCHIVMLPLKEVDISSAQLVILQAMMFEKPIIITESETIKDYIQNGYNAIVIKKDKAELLNALESLDNNDLYQYYARNGRSRFVNEFSAFNLGRNISKIV